MQKDNPLFEDMARLMSSVAGTVAGAGREAEARMREKFREAVGHDFVTREEFEAVRDMATNARAEVAALRAELAALRPDAGPAT
jgi:BMFP domain-containing protein YqiC